MKTTETITKKYQITKDLVVTVKSDPIAQDGMVETWKNTVTIKKVVEKLDPLSFKDGDAIAEFVGEMDFDDPQMSMLDEDGNPRQQDDEDDESA